MDYQKLFKNKKNIYIICAVFAAGLLMLFFNPTGDTKKAEKGDKANIEISVSETEQRLESILSSIKGVGKTEVFITLEDRGQKELAYDYKSNIKEDSAENEQKTVVVNTGGGSAPIIIRQSEPKILGVLVAAEGANNEDIKMVIHEAVAAVLPVLSHRIAVVEKK